MRSNHEKKIIAYFGKSIDQAGRISSLLKMNIVIMILNIKKVDKDLNIISNFGPMRRGYWQPRLS